MGNNITFKVGALSNLSNAVKKTGQLLFAYDNTSGSIYYDKDSSTRIKFNLDANKLLTTAITSPTETDTFLENNVVKVARATAAATTIGNDGMLISSGYESDGWGNQLWLNSSKDGPRMMFRSKSNTTTWDDWSEIYTSNSISTDKTWRSWTVDLSDTTIYDENTWYPVVGERIPYTGIHHLKCAVQLNSGSVPSWSNHANGFTCNLEVLAMAGGWGTTNADTILLNNTYKYVKDDKYPVTWYQMTNSSKPVFYCRGGGKYMFYTDYQCIWTIKNVAFTESNLTVEPVTEQPLIDNYKKGKISANLNGIADYVYNTLTDPTSRTSYYIPFIINSGIRSEGKSLGFNNGFFYRTIEGTTNITGESILVLGNSKSNTTAGNKSGFIRLMGPGENSYTELNTSITSGTNTVRLPAKSGYLLYRPGLAAVGSSSRPVYIDGTGEAITISSLDLPGNILISSTSGGIRFEASNGIYSTFFGIGSGGENRGIYDSTLSEWVVYTDAAGKSWLSGNADTATKLKTAITLTVGSTGKSFDGSSSLSWSHTQIGATVSNAWTNGTTAGPKLTTTVNGVAAAAVTIPSASTSVSGIVTNVAQTFAGNKLTTGQHIGLVSGGEVDQFLDFAYASDPTATKAPGASWRIGALNSGSGDTNYFVIQTGGSDVNATTWNNVIRLGMNTFDAGFGGNIYPLTNNSKSLGTSSLQWKDAWFSGTVTITNTTDASGSADRKPALIVGGTSTTAHLELDANELMSKSNGTTPTQLYLNSEGGLVHIGAGGLQVDSGDIQVLGASGSTAGRSVRVTNANGNIGIFTSTNQGLYDFNKDEWIIYRLTGTNTTLIPAWGTKGSSSLPIYFSGGQPIACSSTLNVNITGSATLVSRTFNRDTSNAVNMITIYDTNNTTLRGLIGFHNTGGDGTGSAYIIPYPATTDTWGGTEGLYIGKGELKIDNSVVLTASNYTDYTVTKTGSGASGTWGINITGSAEKAAALTSSGTITMITGTDKHPAGFTVGNIYNSGYPFNYGSTWRYQGTFGAELIFNGLGGDAGVGTGHMYFRTRSDWITSTWGDWKHLLDSSNYTSYTVTKTGSGASGTWGINITGSSTSCTGNAATATKLATARNIFGRSFNGTTSIEGKATVYGSYNATVNTRYSTGALEIRENGLVGTAQSDISYAPQIGFHWSGRVAGQLALNSSAQFCFITQAGEAATVVANLSGNASTATALTSSAGSSTSPIYFSGGKPVQCGRQPSTNIAVEYGSTLPTSGNYAGRMFFLV